MFKLSEDEARGLDAIYKTILMAAIVLGGGWTLIQYLLHRAEERETAAIEARKPFLERRLQVYDDLVLAASTIVSGDPDEVEKAKKRFAVLSSGRLIVFEDAEVAGATQGFSQCVEDSKQCQSIRRSAQLLALACRKSLGEAWGLNPPGPPGNVKVVAE